MIKTYLFLIILSILSACGENEQQESDNIEEIKPPERVVALGGTITEIIYALDKENLLVGADFSSLYPEEAKELPKVGIWRMVTPEAVLGLKPDLVIAMPDAGPDKTLETIKQAEVELMIPEDGYSVQWTKNLIKDIGQKLGAEDSVASLLSTIEQEQSKLDSLKNVYSDIPTPSALFFYIKGGKVYLVAGKGTTPDAMMNDTQINNLANDLDEWSNVGPEYSVAKNPDFIIVSAMGMESINGIESLKNTPGLGELDAVKNVKIYIVDELAFLGYGPRVIDEQIKLYKYSRNID